MGFSFKKVFKKSEGRDKRVLEDDGASARQGTGDSVPSSQEFLEGVPSLPPPPLDGNFSSPFDDEPEAGFSPFNDSATAPPGGVGLEPTAGAGLPVQSPELSGFEVSAPPPGFEQPQAQAPAPASAASPFELPGINSEAPAPIDPAAAPLPLKHDVETTKDLESKGFRPLSSLPNPGNAQPATAPIEQPMHDLPDPQRSAQPSEAAPVSPFEIAGSRNTPLASQPPQQPQPPQPAQSPFEIAQPAQPAQPAQIPPSPFEQTPQAPASPFEQVQAPTQAPVPSGPIPEPINPGQMPGANAPVHSQPQSEELVAELPPGALEDTREFVEMNLLQLLSTISPAELGVPDLVVSPFAKTRIPMAMLRPQLPTGQVFLNVSDVIVGCSPEHRASLIGCNPTLRLRVPVALIFPTAGEPPAAPVAPAPAADPFGAAAVAPPAAPAQALPPAEASPFSQAQAPASLPLPGLDSGSALPPADAPPLFPPAAKLPPAEPSIPELAPEQAFAPPEPEAPAPVEPELSQPTFGSPLAALAPLGGGLGAALGGAALLGKSNAPEEEAAAPLPPMMPAGGGLQPTSLEATPTTPEPPAEVPAEAPEPSVVTKQPLGDGGWPFDGSENGAPAAVEEIESLEDLPAVSENGDLTPVAGFEAADTPAKDAQSTLRALFLKDTAVDADSVVAHFNDLPGIENSVVLGGGGKLISSHSGFAEQASKLHSHLTELTTATGVADSERFSIRTDSAMISFFTAEGFAIGVKHDLEGFRPGVSERLELVAQQLGALSGKS